MQLCRKKNNIIINAAKHKRTIEEKHAHKETLGLVGDQGKTHYGENPCKFFFSDCHQMIQQKRVQWYISSSMQLTSKTTTTSMK